MSFLFNVVLVLFGLVNTVTSNKKLTIKLSPHDTQTDGKAIIKISDTVGNALMTNNGHQKLYRVDNQKITIMRHHEYTKPRHYNNMKKAMDNFSLYHKQRHSGPFNNKYGYINNNIQPFNGKHDFIKNNGIHNRFGESTYIKKGEEYNRARIIIKSYPHSRKPNPEVVTSGDFIKAQSFLNNFTPAIKTAKPYLQSMNMANLWDKMKPVRDETRTRGDAQRKFNISPQLAQKLRRLNVDNSILNALSDAKPNNYPAYQPMYNTRTVSPIMTTSEATKFNINTIDTDSEFYKKLIYYNNLNEEILKKLDQLASPTESRLVIEQSLLGIPIIELGEHHTHEKIFGLEPDPILNKTFLKAHAYEHNLLAGVTTKPELKTNTPRVNITNKNTVKVVSVTKTIAKPNVQAKVVKKIPPVQAKKNNKVEVKPTTAKSRVNETNNQTESETEELSAENDIAINNYTFTENIDGRNVQITLDSSFFKVLRKQTEILEKLLQTFREEDTLRMGAMEDFDQILNELEEKQNTYDDGPTEWVLNKRITKKTVSTPKPKLTTIVGLFDETEVRKALKSNPYVRRILSLAKKKRERYLKKARQIIESNNKVTKNYSFINKIHVL